ncbi:MAG: L-histidine N(alpha)-methyltransferase [Hyphomicrobiales bacterium]
MAADGATPQGRRDGKFAAAVLDGLNSRPRFIPSRFLYDARGSELFEAITRLDEYYLTRTEIGILRDRAGDIARLAGPGRALVEFGSGSSRKTRILLDHLDDLAAYVPIDISTDALDGAVARLNGSYPGLDIVPVEADFGAPVELPREAEGAPRLGFFPGSTIGNLETEEAVRFLANARDVLGPESSFIVGADLSKSPDILIPAYDDASGVTAAFTLNLLRRINAELDADFDLDAFAHEAVYNEAEARIEIYLRSLARQSVRVAGRSFDFGEGERIRTEYSHKYSIPRFRELAGRAGWMTAHSWTDADRLFSLHYLLPAA